MVDTKTKIRLSDIEEFPLPTASDEGKSLVVDAQGKLSVSDLAAGPQGDKGDTGDMPDHLWSGTALSFEKPDGSYGAAVDLKGDPGDRGEPGIQGPKGDKGDPGDGSGDVVGPASSTDGNIAVFDGTGGKILKDTGVSAASIGTIQSDLDTAETTISNIQSAISNVDNTADLDKPISTATQAALDLKLNSADLPAAPDLSGYATTAALNDKVDTSQIGTGANQLVQLDANGKLPAVSGENLTDLPGGSGSMVLIQSQEVTTPVASVEFTGLDDSYAYHVLVLKNLKGSYTDYLVTVNVRTSADNGSTYHTASGDYYDRSFPRLALLQLSIPAGWGQVGGFASAKIANLGNSGATTQCLLGQWIAANKTNEQQNTASTWVAGRSAATLDNAIKIAPESGNLTAGEFYLYGVVK